MTKDEAIALARTHLDQGANSGSSAGQAVRIDPDYRQSNAEWLGKMRATIQQKMGIQFPPTDETAAVPHWLVSFTSFGRDGKLAALQQTCFKIYDDGQVEQLPTWLNQVAQPMAPARAGWVLD